jgi:hypothetical protein
MGRIYILDTKANQVALNRARRLAQFLGVSINRAAAIVLEQAPPCPFEQIDDEIPR